MANDVFSIDNGMADDGTYVYKGSAATIVMGGLNDASGNQRSIIVKRASGLATAVTLPRDPFSGEWVLVKDGKGDALTNNITITPSALGAGGTTIDGGSNYVLSTNYGTVWLRYNGIEWNAVADATQPGTSPTFVGLTLTGLEVLSPSAALTAVGTNQATALQLTKQVNTVTVGASTTGVLLPLAVAGTFCIVVNQVANSIHVYGAGTDTINSIATATGIVQPPGTTFVYYCTAVAPGGNYAVYLNPPNDIQPNASQGTLTTVGAGALLSAVIAAGAVLRTGATSAFTDTTDTGTQLAAALPGIQIGQSFPFVYQNSTYSVATLTGGTGVASAATFATVGPGSFASFLFKYTAANTFTVTQTGGGDNWIGLPSTSYSTGTTTTTFTAAQMTGGKLTIYTSTAATPGSIATPTATAMFAAIQGAYVGLKWIFRVINDAATNSLTVTADGSVTLSGKTTYVATPFGSMDFEMTFTSATTATMKYIGGGQSTTV